MNNRFKGLVICIGAVVISTIGIQASDTLQGLRGSLTGAVIESTGPCAAEEALFLQGEKTLCIDVYEASPHTSCVFLEPKNELETNQNMNVPACKAQSAEAATPWRFVSYTQAQQLCARSGKRLPTALEWYQFSVGLSDQSSCVVSENKVAKTSSSRCRTPAGVYDTVGNVWEWVTADIVEGVYGGSDLPKTGYVHSVDPTGVAIATGEEPATVYNEDYFWSNHDGVRGMIRGGFYGSDSDAGLFAVNTAVPLDFRTTGIGFRCVRDV